MILSCKIFSKYFFKTTKQIHICFKYLIRLNITYSLDLPDKIQQAATHTTQTSFPAHHVPTQK